RAPAAPGRVGDRSPRRRASAGGEEVVEGDPAGPQAVGPQGGEVAGRLRGDEGAEPEVLARDGGAAVVGEVLVEHLHEHARGRAALVELAGGVQEPGTDTEGRRHAEA